jgi:hypothetical protein
MRGMKEAMANRPSVSEETKLLSLTPINLLVLLGTVALILAYVIPLRGGGLSGYSYSLLFGPRAQGRFVSTNAFLLGLVRGVAFVALLIGALLVPTRQSLRALPSGLLLATGITQGLYFAWFLVSGSELGIAAWLGLLAGILLTAAGVLALPSRSSSDS